MSRSMWSGSINFGLVSIPVRLHSAVRDKSVRFHQVDSRDRSRIRQRLVNERTGEEVDRREIVKCYEVAPDECIIVDPKEIKSVAPEASRAIDILAFVDLAEIDPVYYTKPYYLLPDSRAEKPYRLLVEAMARSKRIGIARFVMRGTEYLSAIRPKDGLLCLETMRFAEEVVAADELGGSAKEAKVNDAELKAAEKLIEALSARFEPEKYAPEHRERLLRLIEAKASGGAVARPRVEEDHHKAPRTLKLVDALKASVAEAGKRERPARRKRSA